MKTIASLIAPALFVCFSLAACDAGTSVSPNDAVPASRHGDTVVEPDAAGHCIDSGGQIDSNTSAAQRHQSGRNPDCFEYNDVESNPEANETDESPTEDPKPDPRLD